MRVLITEFISGGGLVDHPLPTSLKQEGLMMLQALIRDCAFIKGCELVVTKDQRLNLSNNSNNSYAKIVEIERNDNFLDRVVELATEVDYIWVVAPEFDGVLHSIITQLERNGIKTLNSDASSIELCADKSQCEKHLSAHNINVVTSLDAGALANYTGSVILKPRDGAGCENVQVFSCGADALSYLQVNNLDSEGYIAQPLLTGEHCSVSALCLNGKVKILSCNKQMLIDFPQPKLSECIVNAFEPGEDIQNMVKAVAKALPGLSGYIGIDFIATEQGSVLIEINPRLTTSYIGLHKTLVQNPAQLCLDTEIQQQLPEEIQSTQQSFSVKVH